MSETLYNILGLERSASTDEIKHAYRLLARKYHPDAQNPNASETLFHKISEAYSVLSSSERKEKYDETLGIVTSNIEEKRGQIFDKMESGPGSQKPDVHPTKPMRPMRESGVLSKITGMFIRKSDALELEPEERATNIRGERIYKFSIDGLESLTGATRELALRGDNDQPRMLKVKIPAGTCDGDNLRVNNEFEGEEYIIKVSITPHEFVLREGRDIILRVPITIAEALRGVELDIPLLKGRIPVPVPANWDVKKRIRIKGRGILRDDKIAPGDVYLELVLISPDLNIPQVEQIAKLLEEGYSSSPRVKFPKDFGNK